MTLLSSGTLFSTPSSWLKTGCCTFGCQVGHAPPLLLWTTFACTWSLCLGDFLAWVCPLDDRFAFAVWGGQNQDPRFEAMGKKKATFIDFVNNIGHMSLMQNVSCFYIGVCKYVYSLLSSRPDFQSTDHGRPPRWPFPSQLFRNGVKSKHSRLNLTLTHPLKKEHKT